MTERGGLENREQQMRKVRLRSQTCSQTRHDLPQDGLKKKKKKSVPLDVKPVCAPDGSFCSTVFSDCRRPEGFFYAHVRALTVSHWMSGLKSLAGLFGGNERYELDGCTARVGFAPSGIFFCRLHSQPTWLCQTHRGLPVRGSPTRASSTWGQSSLTPTSYLDLQVTC